NNAGESISSVHENVGIRKNLKQDAPESTAQGIEHESSESDTTDVDKLSFEKARDSKAEGAVNKKEPQLDEDKVPTVKKTIGRGDKSNKDFGNNLPEKSKDEVTPSLPSVTDKEVNRNLVLPPSTGLNEDVADLQKSLQFDKKVDIEENKPSENNTDKLLEGKKEKEEDQAEKEEVKKSAKNRSRKNQVKPITRRDEENKQEEEKNLQKWTKLDREPIKEWYQKNAQSKLVYKRQYDKLNEHLPTTVFINDYSKQLFYCIKKNNLVCLRGITSKLEELGLTTQEVLKLRNKLGDTPLIYAVKQGEVDIVRFLLLQGADPKVVNNSLQSPVDIAIERGRVDMINAITEMIPHLLKHKRIGNKESLEIYNWAVKTKEDNELQCNEDQER
ncbi:ankyrin repeat domain-containing protein, partial [Wolbachia endosymbiont of Mansonella ozzardi]|uniref:ankyrin repeat domain-containing protein n=1 Tax=Wolbachia endosymbiont of Mansonella ozzardi TaxID=137464 RepID=UPI001CE09F6B